MEKLSSGRVFIHRVGLKNYRSIARCSVDLGPLNFFVGPNGSGKSNFLDALRLVTEAINTSLEHALRERGGINEVRRRSSGHPTHFEIRLDFSLENGRIGTYAFKVGAMEKGGFEIQREVCKLNRAMETETYYEVQSGKVIAASFDVRPAAVPDRLYLVTASGLPEFRPLYDALSHMGFYNLNPDEIRDLQPPDPGEVLRRDGSNLASVLALMKHENEPAHNRVVEFLSKVMPGVTGIEIKHVGKKETLEFRQQVGKSREPWRFAAESMSDGTLRALGVITALFQSAIAGKGRVPLVGIEEPETALHPGAAGVLRDALKMASMTTQVLVTSHSPDLLDDASVSTDEILSVVSKNGETLIGPVSEADKSLVRDRLYTVGELLRQSELKPDQETIERQSTLQTDLFAGILP